ncbi:MAG: transposase [Gallionella sp.]|nr:transposase [Gallionella sp.]
MTTRPHGGNLRVGRVSEIGRGYLVTTVTQNRLPLFADFHLARLAIRELRACDEAGLCATLAFVLMPDHLHWLLQLNHATLPDLLGRFKSLSGGALNRSRRTPGITVWQAGFHDRAVRDGEDLQNIARYIVANPVRAGLAGSVREYSHWDAVWL